MQKTPFRTKHKKHNTKHMSDLEKIKAYLWETSHGFRNAASNKLDNSIDLIKDKSESAVDYMSEKPLKTAGITLVTGLIIGACVGFFIRTNRDR